ncbi:MAG: OmpH/Skp family outer membrane protein [Candidatus Tyrphobacter sp.]
MKKHVFPLLVIGVALLTAAAPAATGRDLTDVGYIDQSAIAALPAYVNVSRQLAAYKAQLDRQYAAAIRNARTSQQRQQVGAQFSQRFNAEQRSLAGPSFMRAQLAIASVASTRSLSVVVDKRIIIYGGQDITRDVVRLLQGSQSILPLGTAPPPSEVGYVDQTALANSPQVKAASQQMAAYAERERQIYGQQFARAGSDTSKQQQIAAAYNTAMSNEQNQVLKPVVDHAQAVTAQIAQRKGLLLIIDHADILFGGTDITTDVQNALNK